MENLFKMENSELKDLSGALKEAAAERLMEKKCWY